MSVYTTIEKVMTNHEGGASGGERIVLREEQEKSITDALKYFKKPNGKKYLWNAKMRFGKTVCALELAKRMGELEGDKQVRRTLILTHRPVVNQSWREDFGKIFWEDDTPYQYGTKSDEEGTGDFYELEQSVETEGGRYVFFASMQYLRRSTLVGGDNDEQLKKDLLNNKWDLVVIDEAHEGTRTSLGQLVIDRLTSDKQTKVLHLSGTPFNLYEDFTDDQIYTWDYIKEQTAKREWREKHPQEPEERNPYRELPEMEIRTYDLGKLVKEELGEDASFSFTEFFRTRQGSGVPAEDRGRFVHEDAVRRFLDLMCEDDEESHYPFSTDEYRRAFNHTLWVVPGVKEAKALERLLNEHEIFGNFDAIINVAGNNEGDEARQDALDKVKEKIGDMPEYTYTITISCGRLTTGVTVRPWTAVFYLKGSENTSAATYMQTIFRVQSPYTYEDENGDMRMKTKCYVFDFAPDRTLKMVAETAKFATLTQKQKSYAKAATSREKDIENMEGFLQFCPVIAMEGGRMVEFRADKLFEQLDHVYVDRVVRNGFNDNSLYDIRQLMQLDPEEVDKLDKIGVEIGKTTNMEKPKRAKDITMSKNKLTPKQQAALERAKAKKKKDLTPEEKEALEAEKKRKEAERKERDNRITILRGISLRIPLLMYGAKIKDEDEGITLSNFTSIVDDDSWAEFMPKNVTKQDFNKFRKCYNATVFVAAGKRYRQLAREADQMHTEERVQRISEIFSYFHNPDKETVLTPWRVVNMHLSDCLGGYTFFNERFNGPNEVAVAGTDGKLLEWIETTAPRFVDRGEVTREVFGDTNAKILEINSKTGLYPLYVAYSLFRERQQDFVKAGLIEDADNFSIEEEHVIWDDILANNIYVITNTDMARRITIRTLLGFRKYGDERINIKSEKLISRAMTEREALIRDLQSMGYWQGNKSNKDMIKFSAVVGNPPYQVMDGGTDRGAVPVYQHFVSIAKSLNPSYISMIMPARWYAGGRGLEIFRSDLMSDTHLQKLFDYELSKDLFPTVDIAGGLCTFLWNKKHDGKCEITNNNALKDKKAERYLNQFATLIRSNAAVPIIEKITSMSSRYLNECVLSINPFGFRTYFRGSEKGEVRILTSNGWAKVMRSDITRGNEYVDKYKIIIGRFVPSNGEMSVRPGDGYRVLTKPKILKPNEINTETYIDCAVFNTSEEANNYTNYISSKFARYLLRQGVTSVNVTRECFAYVPLQDFTSTSDIDWSQPVADIDRQLYRKYGLTDEETAFIEKMIKPMV